MEVSLVSAKAKKRSILSDKVSGDNIYKALVFFDRMYDKMNEAEKREFLEQLIKKVEVYDERQSNGQWLKAIEFKLPIIEHDMKFSLDNGNSVESLGLFTFGTCRISTLTIPARPDHALCLYGGRQFKDGRVNKIRLPAFCEPALREFWKDQRDITIVPRSDPAFGEMVCALSPMGIRSDDVLPLLQMTCHKESNQSSE